MRLRATRETLAEYHGWTNHRREGRDLLARDVETETKGILCLIQSKAKAFSAGNMRADESWQEGWGRFRLVINPGRDCARVLSGTNQNRPKPSIILQLMKPTLLVVDDDHSVRKSLIKLLEMEDFEVLSARDAEEAIALFSCSSVDLVVLDVNLGEESGWKVFERMKELNPFIPTMVITAEFDQRAIAIAAGAEALIEKPMDVPAFLRIVRDLLAETNKERLARVCGDDEYCRFVAGYYAPFFRHLDERRSAPMKLSRSLSAVLSARNFNEQCEFGANERSEECQTS